MGFQSIRGVVILLLPLPSCPSPEMMCWCGHDGNSHSHVLYDWPCLDCECFMFDWSNRQQMIDRFREKHKTEELVRKFPALATRIKPREDYWTERFMS
jgi:hypothetical protein